MRHFGLAVAVMVTLTACGGGDTVPTTAGPSATSATTVPGPTSTTSPVVSESPIAEETGLASIVILTPTEGVGERPDLAWESVDGASTYRVTVLTSDGSFYWGWLGSETSVPLGGFPRLVDGATGPRVASGMTWTVVAYDADLIPLAVGGPSSLSR